MPCITYDPSPENLLVNELTALLCEATALLEVNGLLTEGSIKLKAFYLEHLSADTNRLKRERLHAIAEADRRWYASLDDHEKKIVDEMKG